MEHFIAYTDVLRELRSVFMSRDISRSIQQFHGKPISRVLNKFMDDIARGGIDKSNSVEGIDYLRGNFSRSAIGLNPVVFESVLVEPTLGLVLFTDKQNSYRWNIGYCIQGYGFRPGTIGLSSNSAHDSAKFDNLTNYFVVGFGYTHYFGNTSN